MPSPLSYRPHYHRDWYTSSTVRKMDMTARGIYHELLDLQWEDEHIPADEEEVQKILKIKKAEWKHFSEFFSEVFPKNDDGFRRNPRCFFERQKSVKITERNQNNGQNGGRPKTQWVTSGEPKVSEVGSIYQEQAKSITSNPPNPQGGKAPVEPKFDPLDVTLPPNMSSPEGLAAWQEWIGHLRHKRKPPTREAVRQQLKKLAGLPNPISWIEHSIASGYQGLYEPPAAKNGKATESHGDIARRALMPARLPA